VLLAFALERRTVRALFDEHERTLVEDRTRLARSLGIPVI
jgi:hypothetical protein